MEEILFTIYLNSKKHFWEIKTEDDRGKYANSFNISGGNQLWAMRDITKSLLAKGYIAIFKLDTGSTLKFFDDFEEMTGKW